MKKKLYQDIIEFSAIFEENNLYSSYQHKKFDEKSVEYNNLMTNL